MMDENDGLFKPNETGLMTYPTARWHRAVFKWPVQLWRLGLGPLIGHQMMLITHTGRKTGLPRRTMVESYNFNGKLYAPCAYGTRAQWYQNILVDPRVTIQTADGAEGAVAMRVTDGEELLGLLEAVRRRVGFLSDVYLDYLDIRPEPEDILAKKDRLYWLRFDPTDEDAPPALESDLLWVWPFGLACFLLGWLLGKGRRQPIDA
jgi:deazaflavin-dependent oxidoreductase (nitroreductase family)